uniref:hypothetical protein n=1 Tax=Pigmentiphaga litoralis TaxID=516702 RepID=UPI003899F2E9
MADLDRIERERMLAQLRELGGLAASPPPEVVPAEPAPAPKLTAREQRRLTAHIERLAAFKAEHGRLPSAAPTAPTGERTVGAWLWRQRRALEGGSLHPHPHAEELLERALGLHWHLSPRKAQALEQCGRE